MEKAASPVETPQVTTPAALILSSVGPASADVAPSATASAKPSKLRDFIRSSVAFSRSPNVLGSMRFYTREPSVSRTLSRRRFRPQCQPLYRRAVARLPATTGFAGMPLRGKMRFPPLFPRRIIMASNSKKPDTLLTHAGTNPHANFGVVNPPVYHASTILHPTVAHLEDSQQRRFQKGVVSYGRSGTPTTFALEDAVAALEGGDRAIAYCSGAAACYAALLAFVKAGDHVLMVDTVYGPVRAFCSGFLMRFGVETTFYDPMIGSGIAGLVRENTKVIYLESPGSITFEVQDTPAIVAVAKSR